MRFAMATCPLLRPLPPARQTYDVSNPVHMADLSARFMGTGDERLRRTVELNRGLLPTTGRVPIHSFPQGKFTQGKTPRVSKGKVHHLHRASICEVVFMDTFETGDEKFRYGQAFVDYRSRWDDVIPLRSRTQVGWAFGEFCCRNFTPLVLIRDNIIENLGGNLMTECHNRGVKSAYICPYTPQQDQTKNYFGRVTPRWHRTPWSMLAILSSFGAGQSKLQPSSPTSPPPTIHVSRCGPPLIPWFLGSRFLMRLWWFPLGVELLCCLTKRIRRENIERSQSRS
jgi:hypothetical protein